MRELGTVTATPSGTPQGSSTLAPAVEHRPLGTRPPLRGGMGGTHAQPALRVTGPKASPAYRMIRFADDFVVLVRGTEAQAHVIKEQTAEFMREQMRLTLSPEKTTITHVDDGFDLLGFRIVRKPWHGKQARRLHVPEQTSGARDHAPHQDADQTQHDEPLARRADPRAQPRPSWMGQLPPPRREQALLRLPQLLPVVASHAMAAQEVPAADLETDQATVLGARLDRPRRREARTGPPRSR